MLLFFYFSFKLVSTAS